MIPHKIKNISKWQDTRTKKQTTKQSHNKVKMNVTRLEQALDQLLSPSIVSEKSKA